MRNRNLLLGNENKQLLLVLSSWNICTLPHSHAPHAEARDDRPRGCHHSGLGIRVRESGEPLRSQGNLHACDRKAHQRAAHTLYACAGVHSRFQPSLSLVSPLRLAVHPPGCDWFR